MQESTCSRYEDESSSMSSEELLLRMDRSADQTLPSFMKLFQSPNPDVSPPLSPAFGAGLADNNIMGSKPIQESQCARGRHEIVLGGNATVHVYFFSEATYRNR